MADMYAEKKPKGRFKKKLKKTKEKIKNVFKSKKRKRFAAEASAQSNFQAEKLKRHKEQQRGMYKKGGRGGRDMFSQQYD